MFNCGHFAAISDEWLPNYLLARCTCLWCKLLPLVQQCVLPRGVGYDAKIVIIVLGSFDCRRSEAGAEVDYTLDRLRRIMRRAFKNEESTSLFPVCWTCARA